MQDFFGIGVPFVTALRLPRVYTARPNGQQNNNPGRQPWSFQPQLMRNAELNTPRVFAELGSVGLRLLNGGERHPVAAIEGTATFDGDAVGIVGDAFE